MLENLYWAAVYVSLALIPVLIILAIYLMALKDICFTFVEQGEIIAIMTGDELWKFIGNVKDHWVDPETGEVWRERRLNDNWDDIPIDGSKKRSNSRVKERPRGLPRGMFGIYFIGLWPFFRRYTYKFKWNKWDKRSEGSKHNEIIPRDEDVDSLYWMSAYAFEIDGAENRDRLPMDIVSVVTIRIVNAQVALFGVKNGWLAELDANVSGTIRDFVGSVTTEEISRLQHEESGKSDHNKRSFIEKLMLLNLDSEGNQSIRRTLGVEIVTTSFVKHEITPGPLRDEHVKVTTLAYSNEEKMRAMDRETQSLAKRKLDVGLAEAKAAEKLAEALAKNPQTAGVVKANAIAEAIGKQSELKTLILGQSVLPTVDIDPERN